MILDETCEFCDATALNTGAAGTYAIGDVMDNLNAFNGPSDNGLWAIATVHTTCTSGGSATLQLLLCSDPASSIPTDGSVEHVAYTSDTFAVADLTAGTELFRVKLPISTPTEYWRRYVGILQVTGTAAFTAGKVNVFLTKDPHAWYAYPEAAS